MHRPPGTPGCGMWSVWWRGWDVECMVEGRTVEPTFSNRALERAAASTSARGTSTARVPRWACTIAMMSASNRLSNSLHPTTHTEHTRRGRPRYMGLQPSFFNSPSKTPTTKATSSVRNADGRQSERWDNTKNKAQHTSHVPVGGLNDDVTSCKGHLCYIRVGGRLKLVCRLWRVPKLQ
jgi:hypothetical protein